MPSYVIEFDSNHGPERRLFTLDDDRPLDVQLYQVLEELKQSGRVLQGGPGDELAVSWNGRELPMQAALQTLQVDTARPLRLAMRPRRAPVAAVAAPVVAPYGLRHMVLPPVEGALGALAAWAVAGLFTDLSASLPSVRLVDFVVALLLAGGVGAALCVGSVARRLCGAGPALVGTVLSVALGALALVTIDQATAAATVRSFLLMRVATWMLIAVPVALAVTAPLRALGSQRFLEASVIGLLGGLLGALVASLPGASDLWQVLAFVLCGAAVGGAAISVPVWRTLAMRTTAGGQ
jgi:hypothetical protein